MISDHQIMLLALLPPLKANAKAQLKIYGFGIVNLTRVKTNDDSAPPPFCQFIKRKKATFFLLLVYQIIIYMNELINYKKKIDFFFM